MSPLEQKEYDIGGITFLRFKRDLKKWPFIWNKDK